MEGTTEIYIRTRMRKMGFENFTFKVEAITVAVGQTYKIPSSSNEIYLLFDVSNDVDSFSIKADNDTLTNSEFNFAGVPYILHEFHGQIVIDNPATSANSITFLFIKIYPETKK
jgi:hypothetical protein